MSKRRVPWTLIVIVILITIGYASVRVRAGWRFLVPYEQIRIGMTESQFIELFGRPPDCACQYQNARIPYYSRGGLGDK